MTRHTAIAIVVISVSFLLSAQTSGGADAVYQVNYDVSLQIGEDRQTVSSRMRLPKGNKFPLIFKDFRIDLYIFDAGGDRYSAKMWLYERTDPKPHTSAASTYAKVNPEDISFDGQFQAPVELRMTIAGIELDMAVAINAF